MAEVGILEAKNRLSELIGKAERGEDVVITRSGKPVAKLVAAKPGAAKPTGKPAKTRAASGSKQTDGTFAWEEWKKRRDRETNQERNKKRGQ